MEQVSKKSQEKGSSVGDCSAVAAGLNLDEI